jgi:hypothetical protein
MQHPQWAQKSKYVPLGFTLLIFAQPSNKLYYSPIATSPKIPMKYTQPRPNLRTLAFISSSSDIPPDEPHLKAGGGEDVRLLPDTFLAASENGFLLSRNQEGISEGAWRCTVAGGLAGLEWS